MKPNILIRGMAIIVLLTMLCALFTPIPGNIQTADAQSRCPIDAVNVPLGTNVSNFLNSYPAGTKYCFANGTYTVQYITPETGDQFWATTKHGTIFNGGGARTALNGIRGVGDSPDDVKNVVINGIQFVNYINTTIWQGSFPNEGTVIAYTGWDIQHNLFIGTPSQPLTSGVIFAKVNWGCAEDVVLNNNTFTGISHVAILGNAIDGEIKNNVITNNGWGTESWFTPGYANDGNNIEWNGQFKISNTQIGSWTPNGYNCTTGGGRQIIIADNVVEQNRWVCIWLDVFVINAVINNNRCAGNSGAGFMHEISRTVTLSGNTFLCNNWDYNNYGWPSGEITLWNADQMTFSNNYVRACGNGDVYYANGANRTYNPRGGVGAKAFVFLDANREYGVSGVISNNTVVISAGANMAIWFERYNSNAMPVTFANNQYYVNALGRSIYRGFAADNTTGLSTTNFSGWQAKSKDSGSQERTDTPPTQVFVPTATPGGATATPTATYTLTPTQPGSGCYLGTCAQVPGRITAVNFDYGAAGAAYNDASPGNFWQYFRSTDVDIKLDGGGPVIGLGETGDWLQWTVNVQTTGYYAITLYLKTTETGTRTVTLTKTTGQSIIGANIAAPVVSNWDQPFVGVSVPTLTYMVAGTTTLRLTINQGYVDVKEIEFSLSSGVTNTPTNTVAPSNTPTATITTTPTSTAIPPTAVPSSTPTATRAIPQNVVDALATQNVSQDAAATAQANIVNQQMVVATARAQLLALQNIANSIQGTLSVSDQNVRNAEATANAP